MPRSDYLGGHDIRLIHSGEEYFNCLEELIANAKQTFSLMVYILDEDETGRRISKALTDAAQRGVKVILMVDGFGSYSLSREFKSNLENAGIGFRYFSPLPFPGITQAGRRLHIKVAVADSTHAMVGGINISDKYRGTDNVKAWLDYAVSVTGPICAKLEMHCRNIWQRKFHAKDKISKRLVHNDQPVRVRVSINDWFRQRNEISSAYKHMLNQAKHEVIIIASYFLPSRRLFKILLRSAKRGRKVSVILSHDSDVWLMTNAMEYLYRKLLMQGVEIYEYKDSVLHAKACVIDGKWVTIGSHNLNHLSEFLSIEMNLDVLDEQFAKSFREELLRVMKDQCVHIAAPEFFKKQSLLRRGINYTAYKLMSFSQRLLYIFFRKEAVKRNKI